MGFNSGFKGLKKRVIRMLHEHNAEIIQKESESFSVFNNEEPIRM